MISHSQRILAAGLLLVPVSLRAADTLQSASVTRIFNRVELLAPEKSAVPAKVGDNISGKTAVQTGSQSRTELQFNDQTIARLGANSIFSFERGTRDLNLDEGVILLEVPKNAGGAAINTAAVTAAVTGTTIMIESRKATKGSKGVIKFIVLEGTMRLNLKGQAGESVLLKAGQMITLQPGARRLPEPVVVDIGRLTKTSGLMSSEFSTLKNEPYIIQTANTQKILKAQGKLINLNYGLYGKKKNPVLQVVNTTTQSSLRTDAASQTQKPRPQPASRPNVVNRPTAHPNPPKPPPKPPVCKPPRPPKSPRPQPPAAPPQPPPLPPPPNVRA